MNDPQVSQKATSVQSFEKVTLFVRSDFGLGFRRVEARRAQVSVGPWAQFRSAVTVKWVGKGKRKWRGSVQTSPSLVVVEGWGHPEPGAWKAAEDCGPVVVQEAKHSCFSKGWDDDFAKFIEANSFNVLADFRNHNPNQ